MNELQKRAFVAGARWVANHKYSVYAPSDIVLMAKQEATRRYTTKPTCKDCQFQFDNPFDQSFCEKGFNATRVCKQFKKRGAK
jgi:hypothetical protein